MIDRYEHRCMCWEANLGPLHGQQVLLNTELSLQPPMNLHFSDVCLVLFLFVWDRTLLCNAGCLQTRDPPASASWEYRRVAPYFTIKMSVQGTEGLGGVPHGFLATRVSHAKQGRWSTSSTLQSFWEKLVWSGCVVHSQIHCLSSKYLFGAY